MSQTTAKKPQSAGFLLTLAALGFCLFVTAREAFSHIDQERMVASSLRGDQTNLEAARPISFDGCWLGCTARNLDARAALTATASSDPPGAALAAAIAWSKASLRRSPISAIAWARLAYIEDAAGPGRRSQTILAVTNSYRLGQFNRAAAGARINICLRLWPALDRNVRRQALDEIRWLALIDAPFAHRLAGGATDPAARLALQLIGLAPTNDVEHAF